MCTISHKVFIACRSKPTVLNPNLIPESPNFQIEAYASEELWRAGSGKKSPERKALGTSQESSTSPLTLSVLQVISSSRFILIAVIQALRVTFRSCVFLSQRAISPALSPGHLTVSSAWHQILLNVELTEQMKSHALPLRLFLRLFPFSQGVSYRVGQTPET